ncbi:MAG: ribonuclease P protein component [Pseudomonadota bacterium]
MSPAIAGLKRRAQFLEIRKGVKAVRPSLIVEARRREPDGPMGLGLTATKKIGNAVTRNRARRRLREAARQLLPQHGLAGVDYVLVARQSTAGAPWAGLLDDLGNALIRLRADLDPAHPGGKTSSPRRRPQKPAKPPTESD